MLIDIVHKAHMQASHIGTPRLYDMVSQTMWHPSLEKLCRDICLCCVHCQLYKVYRINAGPPTLKIKASYPFDLVSVDLMSLPKSKLGNVAVLVVIDSLSKWLATAPLRNKSSKVVTRAFKDIILPGLPRKPTRLLSDNGPEFKGGDFEAMLREFNIRHVFSTPYKPSSNGLVERSNRTVIQFLKGVLKEHIFDWDQGLGKAVLTYNNTAHSQTLMSPSSLILERCHSGEKNLLVDSDTVVTWRAGNSKYASFQIGQKVLKKIEKLGNRVEDKLRPKYEGPFEITKVNPNKVTYEMMSLNRSDNRVYRTHFIKLRPFNEVPLYLKPYLSCDTPKPVLVSEESSDEEYFLGFSGKNMETGQETSTANSHCHIESEKSAVRRTHAIRSFQYVTIVGKPSKIDEIKSF